MADPVRVKAIVEQVRNELARITVDNGFVTDLGKHVKAERSQGGIPTEPQCTVAIVAKRAGEVVGSVAVEGVVEFVLPATLSGALGTVYDGADDVERLFHAMADRLQAGEMLACGALLPLYAGTVFLDRPEGLPVVAAEVTFTTGYRR
ncbi:hypothetical protein ABB27_14645 [Stenotrophomonas terrae]|uniref:Uncharacterized protein n=1 Tax=Stenotrophomonas terrae TaxID=405446 RepID=A0A0R0CIQ6_9GAMM|nr:hypothetical protein [Stenotrophomonas terrae]KRG65806.1 hypothetical protein ABB27_14645 [Stenotrophomonas terrae]